MSLIVVTWTELEPIGNCGAQQAAMKRRSLANRERQCKKPTVRRDFLSAPRSAKFGCPLAAPHAANSVHKRGAVRRGNGDTYRFPVLRCRFIHDWRNDPCGSGMCDYHL